MNNLQNKFFVLICFFLCVFQINNIHAAIEDPISMILLERYSGYKYDSSKEVTQDQILRILEAGRLAPSSYNEQPWCYIVCDKNTQPEAYEKALECLVEGNREWAQNAPVLVICVSAMKSAHNNKKNGWAQYDTGAASFGMMLQATSLGLMAHQMGGFINTKVVELFSIPEGFVPMSVMAIGYATEDSVVPVKKRKPLQENFFMGAWGLGII